MTATLDASLAAWRARPLSGSYRYLLFDARVIRVFPNEASLVRLTSALATWAAKKRRWGVPRLTNKMRRLGFCANPKRIARMCREGRLLLKRRKGRKRVAVVRVPHLVPTGPNQRWSMDFVHVRLADGRPFRVLTMLDEGTSESPALDVGRSLTARPTVRVACDGRPSPPPSMRYPQSSRRRGWRPPRPAAGGRRSCNRSSRSTRSPARRATARCGLSRASPKPR